MKFPTYWPFMIKVTYRSFMTNSFPTFCLILFVPRGTTRNLVTCLHIKSKKKPYYQKHIYDPSNKQKQNMPVPEGQTIFKCHLATLQ